MGKAVFCVATSEFQAESIVNEIKVAGFADDEISVLMPEKASVLAHQWQGKSPSGSGVGWLSSIAQKNIPGAGMFIASGPIVMALTGAGSLGIAGAMLGLGLPEPEARRYEEEARSGNVIICVQTDNPDQATSAASIFEQAGADQIASTSESTRRTQSAGSDGCA